MNKHINNTILLLCLFVTITIVTFSYAAFSTELMITGGAYVEGGRVDDLAGHIKSLASPSGDLQEVGGAYRYVGSDPNNYIYYNNEIWRIVGVFTVDTSNGTESLVKIVKPGPVATLAWNSSDSLNDQHGNNEYVGSTIYKYLYGNFYYKSYANNETFTCITGPNMAGSTCSFNGLSLTAGSMVQKTYWNLGSTNPYEVGASGIATPAFLRQSENGSALAKVCIINSNSRCTENYVRNSSFLTYIGLLYPSDIGYSVNNSACTSQAMNGSACYSDGWLAYSGNEWTMSPAYSSSYGDTVVSSNAGVLSSSICSNAYAVRPTLYLKASVSYVSGSGTYLDPILIDYDGAIGVETGLINIISVGGEAPPPMVEEEEEDSFAPPQVQSNTINPRVSYTISSTGVQNQYNLAFSIENNLQNDINDWTITFNLNEHITLDTNNSIVNASVGNRISSSSIKINNKNNNTSYPIEVGNTFSFSSVGSITLSLTYDSNEINNLQDIVDSIEVKNIAENL